MYALAHCTVDCRAVENPVAVVVELDTNNHEQKRHI